MTIFCSRGFETLIGKGTRITGTISIAPNSMTVIDGEAFLSSITGQHVESKVSLKTTLHVSGIVRPTGIQDIQDTLNINVENVIITGTVYCDTIHVEGTLTVKAGATLKAKKILYREFIIEVGAVVHGRMLHLDHVSEGEQV